MLSDALLNLARGTALNTGAAGSYIIGNQVDLGVDERGIGSMVGLGQLYLVITVDTAATSGTSAATAKFALVTDDNAALSSPVVLSETAALTISDLAIDTAEPAAVIALPSGVAYQKYIGLRQTTAGEAFTAGAISAVITPTVPNRFAYDQGAGASLSA